jgi:hypothetical protein
MHKKKETQGSFCHSTLGDYLMTTLALNTSTFAETTDGTAAAKPSFFGRLLQAMMESRQRQANVAVRRAMALYGDPKDRLDYAMLPFAGE